MGSVAWAAVGYDRRVSEGISDADYASHDATALASLIARGEVSALEVVEAAIRRIERFDGQLNAVTHRNFERARRDAGEAARGKGPFAGVPTLLKDLRGHDRGEPSTSGSRYLARRVATHTDELVARFKRAGLVVLGRTNTPEFGIMGITEPQWKGPCKNPWDLGHTPGGSSGGAAAAVAARMVPVAHASDGGGSIRIPASHCGLFGMKVSRGRTPMGPRAGEGWGGLSVEFAVSRSVRDSARLLDAVHGIDAGAPYGCPSPARSFSAEIERDPPKMKIAFSTETLFAGQSSAEAREAVLRTARLLEDLGHDVVEACPRFDRAALVRAYFKIVGGGVAAGLRSYQAELGRPPRREEIEAISAVFAAIGEHTPAAAYLEALALAHRTARDIAPFFETYDCLLTATVARAPAKIGEIYPGKVEQLLSRLVATVPLKVLLDRVVDLADKPLAATPNTQLYNLTGQPGMSVPMYWTPGGLPLGCQFGAAYGGEGKLFALAGQLERARPWADQRPALIV